MGCSHSHRRGRFCFMQDLSLELSTRQPSSNIG